MRNTRKHTVLSLGLPLIISLFFTLTLRAEYGGLILKYNIQLKSGEKLSGYQQLPIYQVDKDSLSDKNFITRRYFSNMGDSVKLAKDLLPYRYKPKWRDEPRTEYSILNFFKVCIKDIELIRIVDQISFSYMIGISTEHTLKDTSWMRQAVVDTATGEGYLCYWQVFMHEKNENITKIVNEFRSAEKKYWKRLEDMDAAERSSDEYKYHDELDEILSKILMKLNKYKVVVIGMCSC